MKRVDRGEFIVPGIMGLFIAAYHWQVRSIPSEVLLWPYLVTGVLAVMLGATLFRIAKGVYGAAKGWSLKKPAGLLLVTALYLSAMPFLGYSASSFLFLFGTQAWLGANKRTAFIVSLVLTALLHLVMLRIVDLDLPRLITPLFTL
jgi:hypothetical protein